jgi:hypothetical protein
VLFPQELTDDERLYYRRFQFQALDEAHANDLMDMQNIECARGFSAAFLLSETVRKAEGSFRKGIAKIEKIIRNTDDESLREKLALLIRRLEVYICFMRTCSNAALFQDLVDSTDFNAQPPLDCRGDAQRPRIERFQNITRAESTTPTGWRICSRATRTGSSR